MSVFVSPPTMSITRNPMTHSVFRLRFIELDFPPPGSDFLVTEDDINLTTENGDRFVTE